MEPKVLVRYCMSGHEIRYSGICPSQCPVCGGPVDLSRLPVPSEQVRMQQSPAAGSPEEEGISPLSAKHAEAPESARRPVLNDQEGAPAPRQPVLNRREEAPAPRQPVLNRREEAPAPRHPVLNRREEAPAPRHPVLNRREEAPAPRQPVLNRREEAPAPQISPAASLHLNYFGMTITIPDEGAWLGREGLGQEWFRGNPYISRRHVFIHPDRNGRLIVEDDRSLNGVYYDSGNGREKLPQSSSVILNPGDILWLYNVPLKLEG